MFRGTGAADGAIVQKCPHIPGPRYDAGELSIQVDAPEFGRLVSSVVPVDGLDLLHVLARDVEIEDLKVLLQPLHLGGLGDHHRVPLQTPA